MAQKAKVSNIKGSELEGKHILKNLNFEREKSDLLLLAKKLGGKGEGGSFSPIIIWLFFVVRDQT